MGEMADGCVGEGSQANADLRRIMASAERLGVQVDEEAALQWLTAIAATQAEAHVVHDEVSGVFGHHVTMLDFSTRELERFRELGRLVEFEDLPGKVETALALSGSAAQSKIQTHPGDADFFERVNIIAETRVAACRITGEIMRDKALSTLRGDGYQLIEVKFGSYPEEMVREGGVEAMHAGAPISWSAADVQAGEIKGRRPDGTPIAVGWDVAAQDPGWCKLDWVVVDPIHRTLSNASNMLDVTWEAPDGTITPLDGYLDPYFQEVYLQAESVPIFSKLVKHVSSDALSEYVAALEGEVQKYVARDPLNYGKAAKRLYNIFRLTGHYAEAAFLRELFDEPTTLLYQVHSLIRTVDDAARSASEFECDDILAQIDALILDVVDALEGEQEVEIVRRLLRLRNSLAKPQTGNGLNPDAEAARAEVLNIVNNFFYEKMTAVPTIKAYIERQIELGNG